MDYSDKTVSGSYNRIKKERHRKKVIQSLSKILGEEYILFTKTQRAHADINGTNFCDKHQFFEAQCFEFESIVESIGDRIRIFGSYVDAMLAAFVTLSSNKNFGVQKNDRSGHISELLFCHERMIVLLKSDTRVFAEKYIDPETRDFMDGLREVHERMAWFLKSHLNYNS